MPGAMLIYSQPAGAGPLPVPAGGLGQTLGRTGPPRDTVPSQQQHAFTEALFIVLFDTHGLIKALYLKPGSV